VKIGYPKSILISVGEIEWPKALETSQDRNYRTSKHARDRRLVTCSFRLIEFGLILEETLLKPGHVFYDWYWTCSSQ
jgi:hypothetical protein